VHRDEASRYPCRDPPFDHAPRLGSILPQYLLLHSRECGRMELRGLVRILPIGSGLGGALSWLLPTWSSTSSRFVLMVFATPLVVWCVNALSGACSITKRCASASASTRARTARSHAFPGSRVGVSADAGVYQNRFRKGQKCWAHLLRKAIKLALMYPRKVTYQRFLDELLAIYRAGKRSAADGRLGAAGRQQRVADLEGQLCELLQPHLRATTPEMPPHERAFTNLVDELGRLKQWQEMQAAKAATAGTEGAEPVPASSG
jgi:hypothetical protein